MLWKKKFTQKPHYNSIVIFSYIHSFFSLLGYPLSSFSHTPHPRAFSTILLPRYIFSSSFFSPISHNLTLVNNFFFLERFVGKLKKFTEHKKNFFPLLNYFLENFCFWKRWCHILKKKIPRNFLNKYRVFSNRDPQTFRP